MANSYFQFKQFIVQQDRSAMKVTTDSCLLGSLVPALCQKEGKLNVLDIGTGTGLLSLMFAQKKTGALIDAIEIDKDAVAQALENSSASPWKERIQVIHADARQYPFRHPYDVIISNPPFYENELKGTDPGKNKAHHNEGLLLSELLHIIKSNLEPDGFFYLLLPFKRKEEIKHLLSDQELAVEQIIFVRQTENHDYFRMIVAGKLAPETVTETIIDEISIKDHAGKYTPVFINLLKDYYLYL